jgi:alpha-tubulin suppressor-like RCC1 family protein
VNVLGLSTGNTLISAGYNHTCALTNTGAVKCWGENIYGQLGDGTNTDSYSPINVLGLGSGVIDLTNGYWHTCALTSTGGVKCWGENSGGQLGDGTTTDRWTPVDVQGLTSGVIAISAGRYHTCAVTSGGQMKCWGDSDQGQLGDGSAGYRTTPQDVISPPCQVYLPALLKN